MSASRQPRRTRPTLLFSFLFFAVFPLVAAKREIQNTLRIVDYQRHLNPHFEKRPRTTTRFIIIHSTESRLPSALRTLSRGRVRRAQYVTHGGHAHFLVAQDGTVYRILDPKYWANHAGVSMWNGLSDLSDYSVGIELEGFHNIPFEEAQYRSLRLLLNQLKERYRIEDRDVLEHYRIAYSKPNRFHSLNSRGRKSDPGADNFDRAKAGLSGEYAQDPDVIAGRMLGSPTITRPGVQVASATEEEEEEEDTSESAQSPTSPMILHTGETAWKVAGAQYDAATTVYKFPNGAIFRGHEIRNWADVPLGTEVRLGVPLELAGSGSAEFTDEREKKVISLHRVEVIVPEVTARLTPWKIANALQNSAVTFYIYPDGSLHSGDSLRSATEVPIGSKVLVAYRSVPRPQTRNRLGEDLDEVYMDPHTLYLFPDQTLKSGDQIQDFVALPSRTRVFAKIQ